MNWRFRGRLPLENEEVAKAYVGRPVGVFRRYEPEQTSVDLSLCEKLKKVKMSEESQLNQILRMLVENQQQAR